MLKSKLLTQFFVTALLVGFSLTATAQDPTLLEHSSDSLNFSGHGTLKDAPDPPPDQTTLPWVLGGNNNATSSTNYIGTMNSLDFIFLTNHAEHMRITSIGRVGIGTPQPISDFEVKGLSAASTNAVLTSSTGTVNLWLRNSFSSYSFGLDAQGVAHIYSNITTPTPILSFSDGKVAIGTTSMPGNGYSLYVGKGILTERVQVKTVQNWPDYVFTSEYKLRPLSEVAQFIQLHGRLPEIPSAQEVEADGIDLAATNALLLKKIEELTLYVLQLENRLTTLQHSLTTTIK